eukprot:s4708_g5.t1
MFRSTSQHGFRWLLKGRCEAGGCDQEGSTVNDRDRRPQLPKDRQQNSQASETLNHGHFQSMPSWFPTAAGYLNVVDLNVHFMPTFPATQHFSSELTPQLAQSCQVPVPTTCAAKVWETRKLHSC